MLKKLMITTALSGLMIGAAVAQGSTPADRPAVNPPAAATNQSDTLHCAGTVGGEFGEVHQLATAGSIPGDEVQGH